MARPRIAIVGDANKSRSPELAKKAAEALGTELARRGCHILVFITIGHKVSQNHRWKNRPGRHVNARVPCCRWSNDKKREGTRRGVTQPSSSQLSVVAGVR